MKSLTAVFLFGVILGAIGMYLVTRPSDPGAAPGLSKTAVAEKPAGRRAPAAIARSGRKSTDNVADSKLPRPDGERKPAAAVRTVRQFNAQEYRKRMLEEEKERSAKRVNAKLAVLTERLGLSSAQAAEVRALLEKQEARTGRLGKMLTWASATETEGAGGGGEAIVHSFVADSSGESAADEFDFDAELRKLLAGDQLTAYEGYRQEQHLNQVEIQANRQLTQLQTMLDLTAEQKDRAYEVFSRMADEDLAQAGSADGQGIDLERYRQQQERRVEAMAEILTPEQLEVYESSSARKGIRINAVGDGAGVIQVETRVIDGSGDKK